MKGRVKYILAICAIVIAGIAISVCCYWLFLVNPASNTICQSQKLPYTADIAYLPAVEAKSWYSLAEKRAKEWHADASIFEAHGFHYYGDERPIDGKLRRWGYRFVSPSSGMMLEVYVCGGAIQSVNESSLAGEWPDDNQRVNISDWQVDSFEAVAKSNEIYANMFNETPDKEASYAFKVNSMLANHAMMTWEILYNPPDKGTDSGKRLLIKIDASTGSVIENYVVPHDSGFAPF